MLVVVEWIDRYSFTIVGCCSDKYGVLNLVCFMTKLSFYIKIETSQNYISKLKLYCTEGVIKQLIRNRKLKGFLVEMIVDFTLFV